MTPDYRHQFVGANRMGRRRFVGGATFSGLAAAAAGIVGCSSNNKPANSGGKATTGAVLTSPGAAATAAAARTGTPAAFDSTKGKPGGSFVFQNASYHGGLALVSRRNTAATKIAGLVQSALLAYDYGRPPANGVDVAAETDLAVTLPEQPDPLSYVFKLRPAKFQNGRDLTAQDVQYSFEQYAHNPQSASASSWLWYDSTQTPDAQTVIVKTKAPFADAVLSIAAHQDAFILAKEFEESAASANKLMGSGPYVFDSDTAPISTVVKKNPTYFNKPYPYFDQITILGQTDPAKQISDFISKQVNLTYLIDEQSKSQVKQSRPDAVLTSYPSAAVAVFPRCDQPPFNDTRVRQALSIAIDRKAIRDATSNGLGEDDQILSIALGPAWGFRKPAQLGDAAKYWNHDMQAAKQLLTAAGIDKPIEAQMSHFDVSVLGQFFIDSATLVEAQWKQAAIANMSDVTQTIAQWSSATNVGDYNGVAFGPPTQQMPVFGSTLKNIFWSPPEGVKSPTQNVGHVLDQQLSALLDKQLTQLNRSDRLQTMRSIEDILGSQMYRIPLSTSTQNYFSDPLLRGVVVPKWEAGGSGHFQQYWWFA